MKPTKKKPAKRKNNPAVNSHIVGKLLKLKYRLNDCYRDENNTLCVDTLKADKGYLLELISDVRANDLTKLCKEDGLKCNGMWRKYEGQ